MRQDLVDDTDAVEADHDRQPTGDCRGLVAALVLQPAQIPFDVHPDRGERVEVLIDAPAQEDSQVGLGVQPGLAPVAAKIGRHRGAQNELIRTSDTVGNGKGSHTSPCVNAGDERQHARSGMTGRRVRGFAIDLIPAFVRTGRA
ncbi:MAG TPA: hypothetical protein VGR06_36830 [Actinophytocola sp.]|uniref:hypothetical protein n=1 Tax=Actinophytocola sp. TaxID=1872138 RepID=UPI002E04A5D0|nr:hypothetical protein [Actinophytocola sp.]